jgi:sugar phosphate isomerase/epimerase
MTFSNSLSRRSFLAAATAAPLLAAAPKGKKHIPIGLELYSVRDLMKTDLMGTVRAVAKLGYEGVEFYSPYFDWTPAYAKEVRKLLDDLGMRCYSTHNANKAFSPESIGKAIELNQILGSKFVVMASAGKVVGLDGWKGIADILNAGAEKLKAAGMRAGYHNHAAEFTPLEGRRPIEVLAERTTKNIMLQLDVGTCVSVGADPVAWIEKNPGRINCVHCKDWSSDPAKGYKVLFGEGAGPWKKVFEAAEKSGGVEYYLIEQEGSAYPSMETVERCLALYKKMRA